MNRWPAAPVGDGTRLCWLALERGEAGARYHAVAGEGIAGREIAAVIGDGLGVTVQALPVEEGAGHFRWFGAFSGMDMPALGAWMQGRLGWMPAGQGLIGDLKEIRYAGK